MKVAQISFTNDYLRAPISWVNRRRWKNFPNDCFYFPWVCPSPHWTAAWAKRNPRRAKTINNHVSEYTCTANLICSRGRWAILRLNPRKPKRTVNVGTGIKDRFGWEVQAFRENNATLKPIEHCCILVKHFENKEWRKRRSRSSGTFGC